MSLFPLFCLFLKGKTETDCSAVKFLLNLELQYGKGGGYLSFLKDGRRLGLKICHVLSKKELLPLF